MGDFTFSPASDASGDEAQVPRPHVELLARFPAGDEEDRFAAVAPQNVQRSFTVHGAGLALAMVRGSKRLETRRHNWWPLGWYNLHVGKKPMDDDCRRALLHSWSDAPDETSLTNG